MYRRNTFNRLLIIYFLFFLASCATTENYKKVLNSYIGAPKDSIISRFGPPDSEYAMGGGSEEIIYNRSRMVQVGGYTVMTPVTTTHTGMITGDVNGTITGTSTTYVPTTTPVQNINLNCQTRFTIRNGVVSAWSFEGNSCKAKDPGPGADSVVARHEDVAEFHAKLKKMDGDICQNPTFVDIFKKSSCHVADLKFEQLADNTKITEIEKQEFVQERDAYLTRMKFQADTLREKGSPNDRAMLDFYESTVKPKSDGRALDLYNGKITWGVYNKGRQDDDAEVKAESLKLRAAQ
ncbi:hypothetical protein R70006_04938 [Paraburkholderia domus]|nr:hypothetical protein R70006_04938 [Paraburkholderia domus]